MPGRYEHLIVGGGLAGGLLALALARRGRGSGVALIEEAGALGGNHTWSFHETDLTAAEHDLVGPLASVRWASHDVRFPGQARHLAGGYASVTSATFAGQLGPTLAAAGVRVLVGRRARLGPSSLVSDVPGSSRANVQLDDGSDLTADLVIDARGAPAAAAALAGSGRHGFQKFVGVEVELGVDGPWTEPLLMDASVPQHGGYRFMYVLPFTRRRVLIEDTAYSLDPALDVDAGRARALSYLVERGARVLRVVRSETGVLPLPMRDADGDAGQGAGDRPGGGATHDRPDAGLAIGYRGGFFHPVTGYSLPLAARVALAIAGAATPAAARTVVGRIRAQLRPQRRFGMMLNRLLFEAMAPELRWTALARFYRLPEPVIARFYASRSTRWDRTRVFLGRPPAGISWKHLLLAPGRRSSRWEASA